MSLGGEVSKSRGCVFLTLKWVSGGEVGCHGVDAATTCPVLSRRQRLQVGGGGVRLRLRPRPAWRLLWSPTARRAIGHGRRRAGPRQQCPTMEVIRRVNMTSEGEYANRPLCCRLAAFFHQHTTFDRFGTGLERAELYFIWCESSRAQSLNSLFMWCAFPFVVVGRKQRGRLP